MADLTFRSATVGNDSSFASATIAIALPAGTASGDLQVIWYGSAAIAPTAAPTHTTPSGWTLAGTTTFSEGAGALNARLSLYYKIAGGAEGSVTMTSSAVCAHVVQRLSYQNPDPVTPFEQVVFGTFSGTTAVASSITTSLASELVMTGVFAGTVVTWTPPTGMTERTDDTSGEIADVLQAAAGASGTKTATASGSTDGGWGIAAFFSAPDPLMGQACL